MRWITENIDISAFLTKLIFAKSVSKAAMTIIPIKMPPSVPPFQATLILTKEPPNTNPIATPVIEHKA